MRVVLTFAGVERPMRRRGAPPRGIVPILLAGDTVRVNDGVQTMRPRPYHAFDVGHVLGYAM